MASSASTIPIEGPRPGIEVERVGSRLRLRVGGRRAELGAVQLRHRSTEPGEIDPTNRQRLFAPADVDDGLAVDRCRIEGDTLIVDFSDGHRARLSVANLVRDLGWHGDPEAPPAPEPWVGSAGIVPTVAWASIGWDPAAADVDAVVEALATFHRRGFLVFDGLPTEVGVVLRVAERLGYPVGQNFGTVFDVRSTPEPTDLAYSSVALPAHTDQPYRRPPPGIQLLHCLVDRAAGGESTLVDGLAAWSAMAEDEPDLLAAMHAVDVEFRYDIGTDTVVGRSPVFETDGHGAFRRIRFSTRIDTPVGFGPAVDRWHAGRRWLARWFDDPGNRIGFRLRAGQVLFMDNHRLLHGRTAFDGAGGRRHLQGCYIEHDGPDSRYRLARRRQLEGAR